MTFSPHDLSHVLTSTRLDETHFVLDVPTTWEQGKGAFGGLVVGAMVRAALQCEDDAARVFRTVSSEIVGPVKTGAEARISVEVLRRGTGLTAFDVKLSQEGEGVLARATVTLAKKRTDDHAFDAVDRPTIPSFEHAFIAPVAPPMGPAFAQHFQFRPTRGLPFSGGTESITEGFISPLACTKWGPAEWVALADCYWPCILAVESAPRPTSTIGFTLHLLREPPRGPLFFRAKTLASRDGYITDVRELFTLDGELVLINPQVFAIVK